MPSCVTPPSPTTVWGSAAGDAALRAGHSPSPQATLGLHQQVAELAAAVSQQQKTLSQHRTEMTQHATSLAHIAAKQTDLADAQARTVQSVSELKGSMMDNFRLMIMEALAAHDGARDAAAAREAPARGSSLAHPVNTGLGQG